MLFDLQGKRKRFIQVIYAGLAILMGGGLIAFGIGGEVSGGLLDGLGIGSGGQRSGRLGADFEARIERARLEAERNPRNQQALLELSRLHVLSGEDRGEVVGDEAQGTQVIPTAESYEDFRAATDAWERYLKLRPRNPDPRVARFIVRAYTALADNSLGGQTLDLADFNSFVAAAAEAQRAVAEELPAPRSFTDLARYLYFAGRVKAGDSAAERAVELTPKASRKQVEDALEQARGDARKLLRQLKAQGEIFGGEEENPLKGQNPLAGGQTFTTPTPQLPEGVPPPPTN